MRHSARFVSGWAAALIMTSAVLPALPAAEPPGTHGGRQCILCGKALALGQTGACPPGSQCTPRRDSHVTRTAADPTQSPQSPQIDAGGQHGATPPPFVPGDSSKRPPSPNLPESDETPGTMPPASPPDASSPGEPPPDAAAAPAVPPESFATGTGGTGGFAQSAFGNERFIGDLGPLFRRVRGRVDDGPPIPPNVRERSLLFPSVRGLKIAENQSPAPEDRAYFSFNYYDDVNKTLNNHFETDINDVKVYRYIFGLEKTFNDGKGSIGLRVPLNNIYAGSREPILNNGGTSTSLGNLSVIAKYILERDPETGNLFSAGIAITPPTGPRVFAGASQFLGGQNTLTFQPFLGFRFNFDKLYIQGFSAIEAPINIKEVTLLYNDIGVGYYLYQSADPYSPISAIIPTFEVHINNPLNHRSEYAVTDLSGTPDVVNLTYGVHFQSYQNTTLTMGLVHPVTGPRPFDLEAVMLLNVRFGAGRRQTPSTFFPTIGG